jgi:uncharacterized protein YndB with AHSA1/START domain
MPGFGYCLTLDIAAPPETVWRVIADYRRDPEWREGVRMTCEPAGEVCDGTTTCEALRMLGSWHHTVAHIREVEAHRSFRFVSDDGRVDGTRAVEPRAGGSRLTVSLRVGVPAPLAPLAPLLGWLFRRRVGRDLARLRRLVEGA